MIVIAFFAPENLVDYTRNKYTPSKYLQDNKSIVLYLLAMIGEMSKLVFLISLHPHLASSPIKVEEREK